MQISTNLQNKFFIVHERCEYRFLNHGHSSVGMVDATLCVKSSKAQYKLKKISGNSIANLKLVASTLFNTGEEGQCLERCRCQYIKIDIFLNTFSLFKKVKIFENILGKQKKII